MSALDALLGVIFSRGQALELSGGLNFKGRLAAVLNLATNVTDVDVVDPTLFDNGNSGSTKTLDLSLNGALQKVMLTANATVTISPGARGVSWVEFKQDATGGRTLALVGVTWAGAGAPTFVTTANHVSVVQFLNDGSTIYASLWT